MNAKNLPIIIVVGFFIVAMVFLVFPSEDKLNTNPYLTNPEIYPVQESTQSEVPPEENSTSGKPLLDENNQLKYAVGVCKTNEDCYVSGCSSQFCSNDRWLITTCEMKDDFPDRSYSCECYQNSCAWIK